MISSSCQDNISYFNLAECSTKITCNMFCIIYSIYLFASRTSTEHSCLCTIKGWDPLPHANYRVMVISRAAYADSDNVHLYGVFWRFIEVFQIMYISIFTFPLLFDYLWNLICSRTALCIDCCVCVYAHTHTIKIRNTNDNSRYFKLL